MQNNTKDINIHTMIKERFAKLSPKLQEAISSTDVANKLRAISQKHHLHIDQGQTLENETYMVLLGVEQSEKYEGNLKKELEVSDEDAKKIANDVAQEIFLSIRNLLKESITPTSDSKNETKLVDEASTSIPTATPSSTTTQPTQPSTEVPISNGNKLESIVKNQSKEIEINPTENYTVDPYREPVE